MSTGTIELGEDQIDIALVLRFPSKILGLWQRSSARGLEVETDLKVGDAEVDGGNGGVLD